MDSDSPASLPARPLADLEAPARPWLRQVGGLARRAAYHLLHPTVREPCLDGPAPAPVRRVYYATVDGWQIPLRVMAPRPGGSGEPVVLAHGLGVHADVWRVGGGPTLARALCRAGFQVYLLAHRGDREAMPPDPPRAFDFDDLLRFDVPAALRAIREDTGFSRIHWVGHGVGGQLGLARAARSTDLASVVALCAPARFAPSPRSEARRLAMAARLLPARWQLPSRSLALASVPWVDDRADLFGHVAPGACAGPRLRGLLTWGAADLPVGLLRQVTRWQRTGVWSDRTGLVDYAETLVDARGPLLVVTADGDALCPPSCAGWAQERWGGQAERLALSDAYGHLDPILGRDAPRDVFRPLIRWLGSQRRRAWVAA